VVAVLITEVRVKGERQHVIMPRGELSRLLKEGRVDGVYKYALHDRAEPEGEAKAAHTLTHPGLTSGRPSASSVITSANVDRDGDIVMTSGMQVENYLLNPVVLPMHVHDFPVGLTEKLKIQAKQAWAQWQWLVDLPGSEAEKYAAWWDAHALNATSIGFLPFKWSDSEKTDGWTFEEWELLEFSPVVIPSNRDAVRALESYGEVVMAGPSAVMKSLWVAGEASGRPKQVAVGSVPATAVDVGTAPNASTSDANSAITAGDPAETLGADWASDAKESAELTSVKGIMAARVSGGITEAAAVELLEKLMEAVEGRAAAAEQRAEEWKARAVLQAAAVLGRG
jgi:hypothetical protein